MLWGLAWASLPVQMKGPEEFLRTGFLHTCARAQSHTRAHECTCARAHAFSLVLIQAPAGPLVAGRGEGRGCARADLGLLPAGRHGLQELHPETWRLPGRQRHAEALPGPRPQAGRLPPEQRAAGGQQRAAGLLTRQGSEGPRPRAQPRPSSRRPGNGVLAAQGGGGGGARRGAVRPPCSFPASGLHRPPSVAGPGWRGLLKVPGQL